MTHERPGAIPAGVVAAPAARRVPPDAIGRGLLFALPAILVVLAGSQNGGFFVDTTAIAALVACGALLLRITLPEAPLGGLRAWGVVLGGAFTLFAVWTLASAQWSGAPARALFEFDRALLYLVVFAILASVARGPTGPRWVLRWLALALAGIALAGLLTRIAPQAFAGIDFGKAPDRLAWPVGYWNTLGLVAGLGAVLGLWLASDLDEPRAVRVAAAGVLPALAVTMYLTLSRGAIAAGAIGVIAFVVLGRPRGLVTALPAVVPFAVLAVMEAYDLRVLVNDFDPTSRATVDAGRTLRSTLALACGGAAVARLAGTALDPLLARPRIPSPAPATRAAIWAASAIAAVAIGLALGAPGVAERQWDRFQSGLTVEEGLDSRARLGEFSSNGRIRHWTTAYDAWREEPVRGHGAGTYEKLWDADPAAEFPVQDGHSLYFEVLGELGLVGALLLLAALATGFAALAWRRREDRVLWSAAIAVALAWAARAGADWDWEMPVVTLPVMGIFGMACAGRVARAAGPLAHVRPVRVVAGLAVLLLAVTPFQILQSQRHVERALASFRAGDCEATAAAALEAIDHLASRTEPFELLAYCDVRAAEPALAVRMLEAALRRDPGNWELLYGLGLVRAAAGQDPRPALRLARRANRHEPVVVDALRRMRGRRPAVWRREALRSTLPVAPGPVARP